MQKLIVGTLLALLLASANAEAQTEGCGGAPSCTGFYWPTISGHLNPNFNPPGQLLARFTSGRWTKVGKLITASFDIQLLRKGGFSGEAVIAPRPPFAVDPESGGATGVVSFYNLAVPLVVMQLQAQPGQNYIRLLGTNAPTTMLFVLPGEVIADNTRLVGSITYTADR